MDNGNKPDDSTGPIISNPIKTPKGGETETIPSHAAHFIPVLGGRHFVTSLPPGFSLRQFGDDITHIFDTPNQEGKSAAKLVLNYEAFCTPSKSSILTTIDGGNLFECQELLYELRASNGDRISVINDTLNKDVLHSIIKSIKSH